MVGPSLVGLDACRFVGLPTIEGRWVGFFFFFFFLNKSVVGGNLESFIEAGPVGSLG